MPISTHLISITDKSSQVKQISVLFVNFSKKFLTQPENLFYSEKLVRSYAEFFVYRQNTVVTGLFSPQQPLAYRSLVNTENIRNLLLAVSLFFHQLAY